MGDSLQFSWAHIFFWSCQALLLLLCPQKQWHKLGLTFCLQIMQLFAVSAGHSLHVTEMPFRKLFIEDFLYWSVVKSSGIQVLTSNVIYKRLVHNTFLPSPLTCQKDALMVSSGKYVPKTFTSRLLETRGWMIECHSYLITCFLA